MQIRKHKKIMNNKLKKYLWSLPRDHHKCRVQMTNLASVNIKLKI